MAIDEGQKVPSVHQFGAVVARGKEVIAVGRNMTAEKNDPSAHAEITAIIAACQKEGWRNLKNCVLYASHQPCVMCFACAAWAEIERIVYANPANPDNDDMYEFSGLSLQDVADKMKRPMKLELRPINHE